MAQQNPLPESVQPQPHDEDEIVHTPTRHRARWIMGILLLILILTTFTVGDEITGLLTGRGRNSAFATWERPGQGRQSITHQEWTAWARSINKVHSVLGRPLPESQMKGEVATTLVLGALAEDAGVAITDKELGQFIVQRFGSAQNYHAVLPGYQMTPKEFEATLRQSLAVARYTSLLSGAWNTPDLGEVEKAWKRQHQEYAFDYVELPVEQMLAEAKTKPLTEEEEKAYFEALPPTRKDSFKSKEKIAADLVVMPYEGAANEALFAKFPKPSDEAELEKQARAYFDGLGQQRFAGKTYEEVKERARAEALTYAALQSWLSDMRSRLEKGLAVNLVGDSAALGLQLQHMPAALEQSEWIASKPEAQLGTKTAALVFGNATDSVAGKFYPSVILEDQGFVIVQLTQKEEPTLPAFDKIAETLREEIWQKHAKEAAVARLEALRDQFGTRPAVPAPGEPPAPAYQPEVEEAKFYEVARAAGLEAKLRDFKERMQPVGAEPPLPIELFARTQPALYSAKPGAVPAAGSDFEGKHAFLLRVRGSRDPDPARMKANEFASASAGQRQAAQGEFQSKAFSLEALEARYGLAFNEKLTGQ